MRHDNQPDSDTSSTSSDDDISSLINILDGLTKDQLKVKRVVNLINDAMLEAINSEPFGTVVKEIAENYTWGGTQFKVITIDVLKALNDELKTRLSQLTTAEVEEEEEEEEEREIEELPESNSNTGTGHPAAAILQTLATQLKSVESEISGIKRESHNLNMQQKQLQASASELDKPNPQTVTNSHIDTMLSLMCDGTSCAMSSQLVSIKKDIAKSRTAPEYVPLATPTLEDSDYGIFSKGNPARLPARESWYTSFRNNMSHYIIVGVVVGVINFRNFTRMFQMVMNPTDSEEGFTGPIEQP